jgi:hypothetical protein
MIGFAGDFALLRDIRAERWLSEDLPGMVVPNFPLRSGEYGFRTGTG